MTSGEPRQTEGLLLRFQADYREPIIISYVITCCSNNVVISVNAQMEFLSSTMVAAIRT